MSVFFLQTGTLTENQMTAVEGWFSDKIVHGADIKQAQSLSPASLDLVSQNIAINRSCTVRFKDDNVRRERGRQTGERGGGEADAESGRERDAEIREAQREDV